MNAFFTDLSHQPWYFRCLIRLRVFCTQNSNADIIEWWMIIFYELRHSGPFCSIVTNVQIEIGNVVHASVDLKLLIWPFESFD